MSPCQPSLAEHQIEQPGDSILGVGTVVSWILPSSFQKEVVYIDNSIEGTRGRKWGKAMRESWYRVNVGTSHLDATGTWSQQVLGEPGSVHISVAVWKAEVNSYLQSQFSLGYNLFLDRWHLSYYRYWRNLRQKESWGRTCGEWVATILKKDVKGWGRTRKVPGTGLGTAIPRCREGRSAG